MSTTDDVTGTRIELGRRFAVDGVELAWDRWGPDDGTALVLGHGYSGSAQDFALVIGTLATERPIIAYERRGHGRSTNTGDAGSYTIDRLVADEVAFLEANGGGPVDLLGHSMGGRIAVETTIEHPELIRSLIMMDTSAWSFQTQDPAIRDLLIGFFETYDPSRGLPDMSALRNPEDDIIEARVPEAVRAFRDELFQGFDPVALRELGAALFGDTSPSMRPRLGEITCPVTVVVGSEDHPFVDQAPELAAEVADGELVVIEGAYHSPQLTDVAAWIAAIEGHLARAERAANR
jgi:pimeloyl-ACP methyl ester carboxylesterase